MKSVLQFRLLKMAIKFLDDQFAIAQLINYWDKVSLCVIFVWLCCIFSLLGVLSDHLNAEIAAGTISSKQDGMDYITWTYFFRRLVMNPRLGKPLLTTLCLLICTNYWATLTTSSEEHCVICLQWRQQTCHNILAFWYLHCCQPTYLI